MNYIGIDPDVEKNGTAFYESTTKKLEISLLTFFQLFDYLQFIKNKSKGDDVLIVVEAGWLNKKSNFRQKFYNKKNNQFEDFSEGIKQKMASKTGRNEEVGKKIIEMCQYLDLPFKEVKPTTKKKTSQEFKKITGTIFCYQNGKEKNVPQEMIDAAMLVFGL